MKIFLTIILYIIFLLLPSNSDSFQKTDFKNKYKKYFIKENKLGYKNSFLKILEIESKNGFVECYYSGESIPVQDNSFFKNYNKSKFINCEHIWPQSNFGSAKTEGAKQDMHHLAPTESKINAKRGNNKFGEATLKKNESVLKNNVFEVRDKYKGNVARAMFYFSVMYNKPIDDSEEKVLREWNQIDPPDKSELKRNNLIEQYQGNRNIFIDSPNFIEQILDF
ncbi:endonuclease [Candidatus Dependentiae bacterium]|nr:endonuclease [Candidatus Dependentiae bacterium]